MRTYWFEVRETTVRSASIVAESAAAARQLLNRAYYSREEGLVDMGGDAPIQLGDMESVGLVSFRSVGSEPLPAAAEPAKGPCEQTGAKARK